MKKNINLAVVGHMDHGKSTFIGRLLYDAGYIKKYELAALQNEEGTTLDFAHFLDIYKEERDHAMTMDTTKRFFETSAYQYTIIDSPGHKEFIKNMLSGVSEAHYAIVIVSCLDNERMQEQTKRHIAFLHLLGIRIITFAINKMDLINYDQKRFQSLVNELKTFLTSIGHDPDMISFIPISAAHGENICVRSENIPWYTGPTIIECLDSSVLPPTSPVSQPLRMIVQHTLPQDATLFGKIETGKITLGDTILFEPAHTQATIASISVLGKQTKEAFAGEAVGITLQTPDFNSIKRGNVSGTIDAPPRVCQQAIVEVILPFDMHLKTGDELLFCSGTNDIPVIIAEILKKIQSEDLRFVEDNPLALHEGEIGIVKLTFKEPIVLERYQDFRELGRFLLVNAKKAFPGIVLKTSEQSIAYPKLVCGISPSTLPHLNTLLQQQRIAMFRINGAFPLPDITALRSHHLPLILDIPGDRKKTRTSTLTDEELIQYAVEKKIDYIGLSYVRSAEHIHRIRDYLLSKNSSVKIIAKIETKEALQHLDAITQASDMLLIDRGDLGTDIGYEKVPLYQDKIIHTAKKYDKKILIATELAISTINADRPTYADVGQIYHFLQKKVDYLVLAEETARNPDPVNSVKLINKILDFAGACF